MRSRLLVVGTLVGAIVLFAWQSISHGLLGLPEMGMRLFPGDSTTASAARAIRALAPENGIYFSRYGVLAEVDISPGYRDKTKEFASMMAKQIVIDAAVVFMLMLLLERLASASLWRTGLTYSGLALAYMGFMDVSYWVWWNFPTPWTIGNVLDQLIGFFLVGVTVAAIGRRGTKATATTAERQGVRVPAGPGISEGGVRVNR